MLTDEIRKFMDAYGVDKSEIWPVPGGKAYAIKHSALERIAAAKGIEFGPPQIIEGSSETKTVVLLGTAVMGDRREWSFGEANPSNNKNAYCWAMAEKRLKDRLTLKHLAVHGLLYSEEEADDFKQSKRAPDEREAAEVIPITDGPKRSAHSIKTKEPEAWPMLVKLLRDCRSYKELKEFAAGEFFATAIKDWPISWCDLIREEEYKPLAKSLKDAEAAANNSELWAG